MSDAQDKILAELITRIKHLANSIQGTPAWLEAGSLALSVIHNTVGGSHPLKSVLDNALKTKDATMAAAAGRSVVTLYEQNGLKSPRLAIAHEIEGSLLDISQNQLQLAEKNLDATNKQIQFSIASFLAGASLEDVLRRLCYANSISYDDSNTSISKLQSALYQPSKDIEIISSSENKQITSWGDTRNKADHGHFSEITYAEVLSMVIGVRAFIDKHLP